MPDFKEAHGISANYVAAQLGDVMQRDVKAFAGVTPPRDVFAAARQALTA